MKNQVRVLTEGAMLCGIYGAIILLDRLFAGMISGTFIFFMPIPLIVYTKKYGASYGAMTLVTMSFLTFIFGNVFMIFMLVSANLMGYVMGLLMYYKKSNQSVIFVSFAINLLVNFLSYYVFSALLGLSIQDELDSTKAMVEQLLKFLPMQFVVSEGMLIRSFTVTLVLISILSSFLTYIFSLWLMARLKIEHEQKLNWIMFKFSRIQAIILGALSLLFVIPFNNQSMEQIIIFMSSIGLSLLVLQGMLSINIWLLLLGKSKLSILTIFLFLFFPILIVIGFMDCVFNIREVIAKNLKKV